MSTASARKAARMFHTSGNIGTKSHVSCAMRSVRSTAKTHREEEVASMNHGQDQNEKAQRHQAVESVFAHLQLKLAPCRVVGSGEVTLWGKTCDVASIVYRKCKRDFCTRAMHPKQVPAPCRRQSGLLCRGRRMTCTNFECRAAKPTPP